MVHLFVAALLAVVLSGPAQAQPLPSPTRIYKLCMMEDPQCWPLVDALTTQARIDVCTKEIIMREFADGRTPYTPQAIVFRFGLFVRSVGFQSFQFYTMKQLEPRYVLTFVGCL